MKWERKADINENIRKYWELNKKVMDDSATDEEYDLHDELEYLIKSELAESALEITKSAAKSVVDMVESELHKAEPKDSNDPDVKETVSDLFFEIQQGNILDDAKKNVEESVADRMKGTVKSILFGEE